MESIKFYFRTYFGFSAREVNGFLVLAVIMLISLSVPPVYDQLASPVHPEVSPQDIFKTGASPKRIFSFDPNIASEEELNALGFTSYVTMRIQKFRKAGGEFRKANDLLKIYGMDTALYLRLKDSIEISVPSNQKQLSGKNYYRYYENKKFQEKPDQQKILDINRCDSAQLEQLRGIGPALASRIIRYRKKLGGFLDTTQFREVYGLKDFSLEELKRRTFIAKDFTPVRILINTATQEMLGVHPYIGWKAAKIIVNWRKQHGVIKDEKQLQETNAIQDVERVKRYIAY